MAPTYIKRAMRLLRTAVELYKMGRLGFLLNFACNKVCLELRDALTFRIETETITTPRGQLRGRKCVSVLGKEYVRFQGIAYAKPPLGPLRFKPPQPSDAWEGVKDALKEGPVCCHHDLITGSVKGSEDCLYLNVFTPELPDGRPDFELKAVLFWIHGGGFQLGSGNAEIYSPDFMLEENVLLVTFNYRLGVLGFLNCGSQDAPGNVGLKDMVMALKWVQENIASFGGDPARVCIFGESAGAAAVQFLILSPLAKGLFSCGISQSGSALCPWALSKESKTTAFTLGKILGCDTTDPSVLVDFLSKIPLKTLVKKQNAALPSESKRRCMPFTFLPSVEPPGPNAFLTDLPQALLERGEYNKVPYITGINEVEGMLILRPLLDNKPPISAIEEDFERTVPPCLNLVPGSDKSKEAAKRMKQFYFKNKVFDKSTQKEYVDLATDTNFFDGMLRGSKLMKNTSSEPVFNYKFTFEGKFSLFKPILNIDGIDGPTHADELGYVFYIPVLGQKLSNPEKPEMRIMQRLVRMWCNFAKFRDPTPNNDDIISFKWQPYDEQDKYYLEINDIMSVKSDMNATRAAFWDEMHEFSSS